LRLFLLLLWLLGVLLRLLLLLLWLLLGALLRLFLLLLWLLGALLRLFLLLLWLLGALLRRFLLLLLFRLSLLLLLRGLALLLVLLLLCVRGSTDSEKKEQNSRADKSNLFHQSTSVTDCSVLSVLPHGFSPSTRSTRPCEGPLTAGAFAETPFSTSRQSEPDQRKPPSR
jgi:hypothetical protein